MQQGVVRHHHPGQPALLAAGVHDAPDETGTAAPERQRGELCEQGVLFGFGQQLQQRDLPQAFAAEAQAGFPGRVQRHGGEVLVQYRQQVLGQLPGAVTFAGAAFNALTEHCVELFQGAGSLALLVNVLQNAGEAYALPVDEMSLAAGQQPAGFQAIRLVDAKLHPITAAAVRAHRLLDRRAHVRQVVGVNAGIKQLKAHGAVDRQAEQQLAALVQFI